MALWRFSIATILLSVSCNPKSESTAKVLHYNQPNTVSSLDPAFSKSQTNNWVIDHLFNQLVDVDSIGRIIPEIAKSWSITENGLIYTFNLRTDVFFHEDSCFAPALTRTLHATDVFASFSRIISPEINSPGSWIFKGKVADVNPFFVVDDSTFQIRLTQAYTPFLSILTMQYASILPQEAIKTYDKLLREHPVGTGPFYLYNWIESQAMFLRRHNSYFNFGFPKLDGVRISFINDRNTAYLEMLRGKIEFFSGVQSSFSNEILDQRGELRTDISAPINFQKFPFLNTEFIGINSSQLTEGHPLKNKLFRQALNFGIDRELLLRVMRNNVGRPALNGFIPRGLTTYNRSKDFFLYDVNKANVLIRESGIDLKAMEPITITTNQDYVDICTFVAKQWEDLGIPVKIDVQESATLREMVRNGLINCFRASWVADYPDEESFMAVFYSKNPAPPNYTRFNNTQFDALYEQSNLELDVEKRTEMFVQMNQILVTESPVIFLFFDEVAWFYNQRIQGLQANALNLLKLETVEE